MSVSRPSSAASLVTAGTRVTRSPAPQATPPQVLQIVDKVLTCYSKEGKLVDGVLLARHAARGLLKLRADLGGEPTNWTRTVDSILSPIHERPLSEAVQERRQADAFGSGSNVPGIVIDLASADTAAEISGLIEELRFACSEPTGRAIDGLAAVSQAIRESSSASDGESVSTSATQALSERAAGRLPVDHGLIEVLLVLSQGYDLIADGEAASTTRHSVNLIDFEQRMPATHLSSRNQCRELMWQALTAANAIGSKDVHPANDHPLVQIQRMAMIAKHGIHRQEVATATQLGAALKRADRFGLNRDDLVEQTHSKPELEALIAPASAYYSPKGANPYDVRPVLQKALSKAAEEETTA